MIDGLDNSGGSAHGGDTVTIFGVGFTGVTATVELAGTAANVKANFLNALIASGPAFSLPVKVKLDNPFLGSNCYIGSTSNPVKLNLTTGTTAPPLPNKPISGNPGEGGEDPNGRFIFLKKNRLVDNSFSAPTAEGCGGIFSFLINPIVNSKVGLPSTGGHNTAILIGSQQLASAENVKAHE